MDWVWYLLLTALLVAGLFLQILTLPGIWLMVGSAGVYALVTHGQYIGLWTLLVLFGMGVISEIVEAMAGGAGARRAGGSGRAAWGALIGGIAGAIFSSIPLPIIGTIAGACLGAFAGALAMEFTVHGETKRSVLVGVGAGVGKFAGLMGKLIFAGLVMAIALAMGLPLGRRRTQLPAPTAPMTRQAK
jgi:uncharacterized protein YqgC (DUF456 family)